MSDMSEKEYLTEETYKKSKRAFILIGAIILGFGLLIGTILIVLGIMKAPKANAGFIHYDLVAVENASLDSSYESRVSEMQAEFEVEQEKMEADIEASRETAQQMVDDFKAEKQQLEEEFDAEVRQRQAESASSVLIMTGVFVILAGIILSVPFFVIAHRREILAFSTQQVIPVAKEATEKITPTVAKSAGTITESVAEGITRGIRNGKKEQPEKSDK